MPPPGEDAEEAQVMVPGDDGNEVKGLIGEASFSKVKSIVLSVCV
jgi:hypothetical protein